MPVYEYRCSKCEKTFTETRRMDEAAKLIDCPECNVKLVRRFTTAGIVFNGEGFYSTDKNKKND